MYGQDTYIVNASDASDVRNGIASVEKVIG